MPPFELPELGFGTYRLKNEECTRAVLEALDAGYRLIDTAQMYKNETAIGKALSKTSVPREDIIVATKLWTDQLSAQDVISAATASLKRLNLEYVDILYIHWPVGTYDPLTTLPKFDKLVDEGLIRHIGISNFPTAQVIEAEEFLNHPIRVNQVECHPYLPQHEIHEFLQDRGIQMVAYSPLGKGQILDDNELTNIAKANDVSIAQIVLAWLMERNIVPIPKASTKSHIQENFAALDLKLTERDINRINQIQQRKRFVSAMANFPGWD